MGRGDRLRRRVAGVPLILVARVQDETKIAGGVAADQRASIHDAGNSLQPLRELDVVDRRVDGRKRAEHLIRPQAG